MARYGSALETTDSLAFLNRLSENVRERSIELGCRSCLRSCRQARRWLVYFVATTAACMNVRSCICAFLWASKALCTTFIFYLFQSTDGTLPTSTYSSVLPSCTQLRSCFVKEVVEIVSDGDNTKTRYPCGRRHAHSCGGAVYIPLNSFASLIKDIYFQRSRSSKFKMSIVSKILTSFYMYGQPSLMTTIHTKFSKEKNDGCSWLRCCKPFSASLWKISSILMIENIGFLSLRCWTMGVPNGL